MEIDQVENEDEVYERVLGRLDETQGCTIFEEGKIVTLPLICVPGIILFPEQILPLRLKMPNVINQIKTCILNERVFACIPIRHDYTNMQGSSLRNVLAPVGTTAQIIAYCEDSSEINNNSSIAYLMGRSNYLGIKSKGQQRFKLIKSWVNLDNTFSAQILILPDICDIEPLFYLRPSSWNKTAFKDWKISTQANDPKSLQLIKTLPSKGHASFKSFIEVTTNVSSMIDANTSPVQSNYLTDQNPIVPIQDNSERFQGNNSPEGQLSVDHLPKVEAAIDFDGQDVVREVNRILETTTTNYQNICDIQPLCTSGVGTLNSNLSQNPELMGDDNSNSSSNFATPPSSPQNSNLLTHEDVAPQATSDPDNRSIFEGSVACRRNSLIDLGIIDYDLIHRVDTEDENESETGIDNFTLVDVESPSNTRDIDGTFTTTEPHNSSSFARSFDSLISPTRNFGRHENDVTTTNRNTPWDDLFTTLGHDVNQPVDSNIPETYVEVFNANEDDGSEAMNYQPNSQWNPSSHDGNISRNPLAEMRRRWMYNRLWSFLRRRARDRINSTIESNYSTTNNSGVRSLLRHTSTDAYDVSSPPLHRIHSLTTPSSNTNSSISNRVSSDPSMNIPPTSTTNGALNTSNSQNAEMNEGTSLQNTINPSNTPQEDDIMDAEESLGNQLRHLLSARSGRRRRTRYGGADTISGEIAHFFHLLSSGLFESVPNLQQFRRHISAVISGVPSHRRRQRRRRHLRTDAIPFSLSNNGANNTIETAEELSESENFFRQRQSFIARKVIRLNPINYVTSQLTHWPAFVYKQYDLKCLVDLILKEVFIHWKGLAKTAYDIPEDPFRLVCWINKCVPIDYQPCLRLLQIDNIVTRLRTQLNILKQCKHFACKFCQTLLFKKGDVFNPPNRQAKSTFVNPSDKAYEFVTVKRMRNVSLDLEWSNEFTWFSGYSWTILHCRNCNVFIGWAFHSDAQLMNDGRTGERRLNDFQGSSSNNQRSRRNTTTTSLLLDNATELLPNARQQLRNLSDNRSILLDRVPRYTRHNLQSQPSSSPSSNILCNNNDINNNIQSNATGANLLANGASSNVPIQKVEEMPNLETSDDSNTSNTFIEKSKLPQTPSILLKNVYFVPKDKRPKPPNLFFAVIRTAMKAMNYNRPEVYLNGGNNLNHNRTRISSTGPYSFAPSSDYHGMTQDELLARLDTWNSGSSGLDSPRSSDSYSATESDSSNTYHVSEIEMDEADLADVARLDAEFGGGSDYNNNNRNNNNSNNRFVNRGTSIRERIRRQQQQYLTSLRIRRQQQPIDQQNVFIVEDIFNRDDDEDSN